MHRPTLHAALLVVTVVGWSWPARGQDVFFGGRLDLELIVGDDSRLDFGRWTGIDITYRDPKRIDAYFDFSYAGGLARVQEFYVSLPQTRRVAEVAVGRVLLPYADPDTAFPERYVLGAPDFFDTYRGYRRGNVLLDTDGLGLWVRRETDPYSLDLFAGLAPGDDDGEVTFVGRAIGRFDDWRLGASGFVGKAQSGAAMAQGMIHAGYDGQRWQALGQLYLGDADTAHWGWTGRVTHHVSKALSLFAAQTGYDPAGGRALVSTRLGAAYDFWTYYSAELRWEHHDGLGDDWLLTRLTAVF